LGVFLDVLGVKKQTGMWVDAVVWEGYREVCRREKLRPGEPVEEFLGFVLRGGSALNALNMLRSMGEARRECFDAYARVLLDWLRKGVYSVFTANEAEASVGYMLLQALRQVADPGLRREVEEALKNSRSRVDEKERESAPVVAEPAAEAVGDEGNPKVELSIEEMEQRIAVLRRVKERLRRNREKGL
jgi:hypothetical protein